MSATEPETTGPRDATGRLAGPGRLDGAVGADAGDRGAASDPRAATSAGTPLPTAHASAIGAGADVRTGTGTGSGSRARAWAELLRLPALFTVPGDALAGAAAVGARPNRRTLLAVASSLCLYEAGMALNDWADRAEDAVDRPHRPIPSGRIRPTAALAAAGAFTAAGVGLAFRAGRAPGALAGALAATVWAYDLGLKRTPAGPLAMGAARGLDLLLGASATGAAPRQSAAPSAAPEPGAQPDRRATTGNEAPRHADLRPRTTLRPAAPGGHSQPAHTAHRVAEATTAARPTPRRSGSGAGSTPRAPLSAALPSALTLAGHTVAVTTVSRNETTGGCPQVPAAALAATAAIAAHLTRPPAGRGAAAPLGLPGPTAYAVTTTRPLLHAALNPSPPLTQRAVGAGIRAMIPLQAALAARAGAPGTALLTAALAPLARRFSRKVSVT
ncbi:SCO3242 family prenyltransferase [Streptomyces sp. NPDC050145]|uniref:SCO3242 family prenyltransferase n=1 Tax=Streptomyces sp. NPDC050145 TaxID=3365602 RepID=UPI00379E81BA